jgi:hypothetical protein
LISQVVVVGLLNDGGVSNIYELKGIFVPRVPYTIGNSCNVYQILLSEGGNNIDLPIYEAIVAIVELDS